ncbi:hypothetical protein LEP1GSC060_0658 [Leptospira weilii serovar Ranarum str. ICFT]|uniref:Uncharacterized protein n=1 Tax=Leptospira weilii serovar Ranarum str. ICFT TaxID=1218598 RepID=N1WH69_9LEPT|nr:hypothetical protein LEP1GSC060_0658 [Leptospira weilii serovar Ranarum str. ICFT]
MFQIRNDTDEEGTIESIKRGVNFSGPALCTLIFVRYLKFHRTVYADPAVDKKIYRYVYLVSLCLILPSPYFAYDIVVDSSFKRNAKSYLENHFTFEKVKFFPL